MNTNIEIPKGWRRLEAGDYILPGDKYHSGGGVWANTSARLLKVGGDLYIRQAASAHRCLKCGCTASHLPSCPIGGDETITASPAVAAVKPIASDLTETVWKLSHDGLVVWVGEVRIQAHFSGEISDGKLKSVMARVAAVPEMERAIKKMIAVADGEWNCGLTHKRFLDEFNNARALLAKLGE